MAFGVRIVTARVSNRAGVVRTIGFLDVSSQPCPERFVKGFDLFYIPNKRYPAWFRPRGKEALWPFRVIEDVEDNRRHDENKRWSGSRKERHHGVTRFRRRRDEVLYREGHYLINTDRRTYLNCSRHVSVLCSGILPIPVLGVPETR